MVVVAYRGKIWDLMKVILLHNTEGHDGVHAHICCNVWFDSSKNEVMETGKWSSKEVDGEYCYSDARNVVCTSN
jgi:hypothetical protein